jgi:hypothetical protein
VLGPKNNPRESVSGSNSKPLWLLIIETLGAGGGERTYYLYNDERNHEVDKNFILFSG